MSNSAKKLDASVARNQLSALQRVSADRISDQVVTFGGREDWVEVGSKERNDPIHSFTDVESSRQWVKTLKFDLNKHDTARSRRPQSRALDSKVGELRQRAGSSRVDRWLERVSVADRNRFALSVTYVLDRLELFVSARLALIWVESHNEFLSSTPIDTLAVGNEAAVVMALDDQESQMD
jgi:hypothetical protein